MGCLNSKEDARPDPTATRTRQPQTPKAADPASANTPADAVPIRTPNNVDSEPRNIAQPHANQDQSGTPAAEQPSSTWKRHRDADDLRVVERADADFVDVTQSALDYDGEDDPDLLAEHVSTINHTEVNPSLLQLPSLPRPCATNGDDVVALLSAPAYTADQLAHLQQACAAAANKQVTFEDRHMVVTFSTTIG